MIRNLLAPKDPPPTLEIMESLGLEPDPWQRDVILSKRSQLLLNCSRQAGKTTVSAILGMVQAMWYPMSRVIIVSRSHRQAREVLRLIKFFLRLKGAKGARASQDEIEFKNESRIVCVPCREDTIRGYAQVDLLIIDEAARVPDDLYRAVRPMLAVSKGRLLCLSTPYGKRGFFWEAWARGGDDWQRFEAPASLCSRIPAEFLEQEKRAMGESWFRQEYCCSFEALEGLVYPDLGRCVVKASDPLAVQALEVKPDVGGLDFGFRNPFAAIWGHVDRDGVLWLTGEHYARQKPLSYHATKLPMAGVMWYADPAGASDISELQAAGFKIRRGDNALRTGIAAVSARIESGTLRIVEGRCPNLVVEASIYRYGAGTDAETPEDEHNNALAALRYLISRLDKSRLAMGPQPPRPAPPPVKREVDWDDDERFWIRIA